jgi:hypothetical protein
MPKTAEPSYSARPTPPSYPESLRYCSTCTDLMGAMTLAKADPKGVHKCQTCRSELMDSYAAKLPALKAAKGGKK